MRINVRLWTDILQVIMTYDAAETVFSSVMTGMLNVGVQRLPCVLNMQAHAERMLGRTALSNEICTGSMQSAVMFHSQQLQGSFKSLQTLKLRDKVRSSDPVMPSKGHQILCRIE